MGIFFELQQHNVPKKITFFMKTYDFENENIVQSEKLENPSSMDDSSIRGCHPWMKMMDDGHGRSICCA